MQNKNDQFTIEDFTYKKYWDGLDGKTCYLSNTKKGLQIELTQHANGLWTYHVEERQIAVCTSLQATNETLGLGPTKYVYHKSKNAAHIAALKDYNNVKNTDNISVVAYYSNN